MKAPGVTNPGSVDARLSYLPGLDGLRAFAVIAVLLYHAEFTWFRGGFLGVEVFFVISGFLITSLLLKEWNKAGGINLKNFWLRRARRLLPALFLLLLGTLGFAVIFLPDEVAGLRGDTLAAIGYVSNWYLIFSQQSYFEAVGRPSLLRHLWSLAVEEQFYLCWPPLLALGLRRGGKRLVLPLLALSIIVSSILMGVIYHPEADPSRVYYGTDTRAAGLLIGAMLAFLWETKPAQRTMPSIVPDAVSFGALAGLTAYCVFFSEYLPFLYRGGFALVSLTTALAIAGVVHPSGRWGPAILGWGPLRWIGQRSYGIYLWHWPVFMLTRPQLDVPLDGIGLLAGRMALTFLLADLSYLFVETPIRNGALGRAWKSLREAQGRRRWWLGLRWGSALASVAICTLVLGISVAGAQQPAPPSYLAVESVQGIVTAAPAEPLATETPTPAPTATPLLVFRVNSPTPERAELPSPMPTASPTSAVGFPAPTAKPDLEALRLTPQPMLVTPLAQPASTTTPFAPAMQPTQPFTLTQVMAIGDSVMLGAVHDLAQQFGNFSMDAAIGRHVGEIAGIVRAHRAAGTLSPVVIIQVGNNGMFSAKTLDGIMRELADRQRVVIVNLKVPRAWQDPNNAMLAENVKLYPNAVLVDWYAASVSRPELFWSDGMHLREDGARLYAALIAEQVRGEAAPANSE